MARHRKFVDDDIVVVPPVGATDNIVVGNRPYKVTAAVDSPNGQILHMIPAWDVWVVGGARVVSGSLAKWVA